MPSAERGIVSGNEAVAIAVTFVWLGMVVAISFVEAPLKFRAPDVTLRIGLGIGRLVFRALNTAEAIFAVVIVVTIVAGGLPTASAVAAAIAVASLVVQLAAIRPGLTRRSDAVLAGEDGASHTEPPCLHRARDRQGRRAARGRRHPAGKRLNGRLGPEDLRRNLGQDRSGGVDEQGHDVARVLAPRHRRHPFAGPHAASAPRSSTSRDGRREHREEVAQLVRPARSENSFRTARPATPGGQAAAAMSNTSVRIVSSAFASMTACLWSRRRRIREWRGSGCRSRHLRRRARARLRANGRRRLLRPR